MNPSTKIAAQADMCRTGLAYLKQAREILDRAGAEKSADTVRRAISSCEGAIRHREQQLRKITAPADTEGLAPPLRKELRRALADDAREYPDVSPMLRDGLEALRVAFSATE